MYFDSNIKGKNGLPWLYTQSSWDKANDEYFQTLEKLVEQIDDLESETAYISELDTCDFDNGYQFVLGRIKELKKFIIQDDSIFDKEDLLESLDETHENLEDLRSDAILYDDECGEEEDEDDDEEDEEDDDDDNDEDFEDFDEF